MTAKKTNQKTPKIILGIAPTCWVNEDLPELGGKISFEQCVSEIALAGFSGTEVGNKYPRDPKILNKALRLRGLTICSAQFSSFLTTRPYRETEAEFIECRDFLNSTGAKVIGVAELGHSIQGRNRPIFGPKPIFNDEEWDKLCDGLNKLGKLAARKGMALVYHPQIGTGIQSADEIDRLLENTEPELIGLLYDTGNLVLAGEDHLAVLVKWFDRVRHVHLKDMRLSVRRATKKENWPSLQAVKAGIFTVPGDGCIDFRPVFKILKKVKYTGWWVVSAEQDPARANPLEYAIKARSYIHDTAGI